MRVVCVMATSMVAGFCLHHNIIVSGVSCLPLLISEGVQAFNGKPCEIYSSQHYFELSLVSSSAYIQGSASFEWEVL